MKGLKAFILGVVLLAGSFMSVLLASNVASQGIFTADSFFTKLVENRADLTQGTAVFEFRNPTPADLVVDIDSFRIRVADQLGATPLQNIDYYVLENVSYSNNVTDYAASCSNSTTDNGTTATLCDTLASGWHWNNHTSQVWRPFTSYTFLAGQTYRIKVQANWAPKIGFNSREWFPQVTVLGTIYEQSKWAWWNISVNYKRPHTVTPNIALTNFPSLVNGSNGFVLGTEPAQFVWFKDNYTSGNNTNYLYYNSYNDYWMANGSENAKLDMEVERGNRTSLNPASVWDANTMAVYHFMEGAGTAVGSSTSLWNGTNTGTCTWTTGMFGYGMSYDGSTCYTNIGAANPSTSAMAVSAWINPVSFNQWGNIVRKDDSVSNRDYGFRYDQTTGTLTALIWTGSLVACTSTATIPLNTWSFVVMSYNGTYISVWINGADVKECAQTGNVHSSSEVAYLGRGRTALPPYYESFNGTMDEVRLYNRSLSPSEINQTYQTVVGANKNILGANVTKPSCTGRLIVTLDSPDAGAIEVQRNSAFTLKATATCVDGCCGNVQGIADPQEVSPPIPATSTASNGGNLLDYIVFLLRDFATKLLGGGR